MKYFMMPLFYISNLNLPGCRHLSGAEGPDWQDARQGPRRADHTAGNQGLTFKFECEVGREIKNL